MWNLNWIFGDSSEHEDGVNFFDDFDTVEQKNDLLNLQRGRINAFKSQDAETGNFDITFDLSGKLLYAHKIFMTTVSTPMEAWISERWSNKDNIIKIETYTYEEFYEFLTFLYSGTCQITEDNVFRLIDMTEFFDVAVMKNRCDKHVSKMIQKIDAETVEEIWEMAHRYSLSKSIEALKDFIRQNMHKIIKTDGFVNFKSSFLDVLFSFFQEPDSVKTHKVDQQLFLSVVKWAEHQVSTKEPTLEGTDFLDAVKVEFDAIKSKFDFSKMEFDFVLESVVSKDHLFSTFECSKILGKCIFGYCEYQIHGKRYLKAVFEIVERDALKERIASIDENFNLQNVIKRELSEILPAIKFCYMKFEVVKEIVVDKAFLFSSKEMYGILAECDRSDEEKYFRAMFELAESESLKEQAASVDENFNLQSVMKRELSKILPSIKFHNMKFEMVKQFVVDKAFLFSSKEMYEILAECERSDEEKYLKDMFELVESESLKEQATSVDENFNLHSVMKRELSKILPTVKFCNMKFEVAKDIIVDKAFLFSSKEMYGILAKCQRSDEEKYFKAMFELAESESLKEQAASVDENFDLQNVMKRELAEVLRRVNFKRIKFDFVKQFVADKALLIYVKELYKIIAKCRRTDNKESEVFEMLYELAKKNIEKRNLPEEMIDLPNAIKTELAECLPKIKFYKMDKNYLIDFAAKTDLITVEQAKSCFYARVQISSSDKLLIGSFEDILQIRTYEKCNITRDASGWTFDVTPRSQNKLRFTGLKFDVPKSRSPIHYMQGVEWYLLLEKDGILTAKHESLVKRGEYLIAELRSTEEFSLALKQNTRLTVSRNTIF